MRALTFAAALTAAAALGAPALAHPQPPGGETCPGVRPGEEVVYCEYVPFPPPGWGNGAYDAGGSRADWSYDDQGRWSDEEGAGDGYIGRRGYIDLDEFFRAHSAQFESGWREEGAGTWGGWSEREERAFEARAYGR